MVNKQDRFAGGPTIRRISRAYARGRGRQTRSWSPDGHDVHPEPLEERRKRLAKLLSRNTKAMRDGIQLSEAITGDGAAIFRHACWMDLEGLVSQRIGSTREWPDKGMVEDEELGFSAAAARQLGD